MKKFIAKIGLFVIMSILLSLNLPVSFAQTQCIDAKKDSGFITTIIEEPFGSASDYKEKSDFKVKDCCRVTYNSPPQGKEKTELYEGECKTACTGDNIHSCEQVMVIFSKGGTTMIEGYISVIYTWAASMVGLIAVTVIIISGIQIAMSGGDSQAVENGKNRIMKSLAGLAVLFLSGLILYTINPNFFTYTP